MSHSSITQMPISFPVENPMPSSEIASEAASYNSFLKILAYINFCALHGASALLPLP